MRKCERGSEDMHEMKREIRSFEALDESIDKLRRRVAMYVRDAHNCEAGEIITRAEDLERDFREFKEIHYLIGDRRVGELKSMHDKLDAAKHVFEVNCRCSR